MGAFAQTSGSLFASCWLGFCLSVFGRVSCSSGYLQACCVVKDDPAHLVLPLSREKMPFSGVYSWRLSTACLLSIFPPSLLLSEFITKLSWESTVQTNKAPSLGNRAFFLPRKMIHRRRGQTNQFKVSTPEGKTWICYAIRGHLSGSRYCGAEDFQDSKQQEIWLSRRSKGCTFPAHQTELENCLCLSKAN